MTIGIVGAGRVGLALGWKLQQSTGAVVAIASRSIESARGGASIAPAVALQELSADRVLIAVPDSAIAAVCEQMKLPRVALHTSGAYGAEALKSLRERGAACGAMHPLQTFRSWRSGADALRGCTFAIDGDEEALDWAGEVARICNGPAVRVQGKARATYHAAAVMAGNHLAGLMDASFRLLSECGFDEAGARRAIAPLARTALENVLQAGAEQALTGPIERGDVETIRRHLAALARHGDLNDFYRASARYLAGIVERRGADRGAIRALLDEAHA